MLIYHVDRSQRIVEGYSARDRWTYNMPNDVAGHPCFRLVTARPDSGDGYEGVHALSRRDRKHGVLGRQPAGSAELVGRLAGGRAVRHLGESPEGVIRFSVRMAEGSIEDVRIEGRQRQLRATRFSCALS